MAGQGRAGQGKARQGRAKQGEVRTRREVLHLVVRYGKSVVEITHPDGMLVLQQSPLAAPLPWAPAIS